MAKKFLNKFTLHNDVGEFMQITYRGLMPAIMECKKQTYKCRVVQAYLAPSPWNGRITEHGTEVFRNY